MDFSFSKIEGTAGWYYDKWPGFLSVDAYHIMEAYYNGEYIDKFVLRNKIKTVKKRKIEEDLLPESFERNNKTSTGI